MSRIVVKSERVVKARPEEIYEVLTDYQGKRQRLLTSNFLDYAVEKGGRGAGTIVRYRLQAAGRERPYCLNVDESVKGKVITERDANSSLVTTWALSPLSGGRYTKVQIVSEWEGAKGIGGFFERTFAPVGLGRIYDAMLSLLTQLLQTPDGEGVSEEEERGVAANVGLFFLLLGVVLVFAFGLWLIRKLRGEKA